MQQQYPVMTIDIPGAGSYTYWNGNETDTVAVLRLTSFSQVIAPSTGGGYTTWAHIQYTLESDTIFQIPLGLTQLQFRMTWGGGPV
jgi:hypothetical protein